jgi:hypothetical protein
VQFNSIACGDQACVEKTSWLQQAFEKRHERKRDRF